MEQTFRHELKFICSERELFLIENKIRHVCCLDPYVVGQAGYDVRSVYFDAFDDECYYQNENGEDDRFKYRIRIYNYSDERIRLERKSTRSGMKHKESCLLTREQCEALLLGRNVPAGREQELLTLFLADRRLGLWSPKITVDYNRIPYVYPAGNVRITFDRRISSSSTIDLFRKYIPSRQILSEGEGLLEVKYDEMIPQTILELINAGHSLRRIAFSKYYLCRKMTVYTA